MIHSYLKSKKARKFNVASNAVIKFFMFIGIISDTHDHIDNLKKAVDIFNANNVEHIKKNGVSLADMHLRMLLYFRNGKPPRIEFP